MKKMLLVSTFEGFESKLDAFLKEELLSKKIVCIPTAAYVEKGYEDWLPAEMLPLQKRMVDFQILDIKGKSFEEVDTATKDADIIYVTGGNTYHLLEQAQACNLKKCIEKCFERGGLYFGSSAGGVVTSPRIDFVEDIDVNINNINDFEGLNLIDFLFLPHLDHKHYGPIVSKMAEKLKLEKENVVGLNDDQGLYIEGSYIRII